MALAPKFKTKKDMVVKPKPTTEAQYLAQSAESVSRGAKKAGRPTPAIPTRNVSLNLPENLIEALDEYAKKHTGKNRSMAAADILSDKLLK